MAVAKPNARKALQAKIVGLEAQRVSQKCRQRRIDELRTSAHNALKAQVAVLLEEKAENAMQICGLGTQLEAANARDTARLQRTDADEARLRQVISDLQEDRESLKTRADRSAAELKVMQRRLEERQADLLVWQKEVARLQSEGPIAHALARADHAGRMCGQMERRTLLMQARIDKLTARITVLEREDNEALKLDVAGLRHHVNVYEATVAALEATNKRLEDELAQGIAFIEREQERQASGFYNDDSESSDGEDGDEDDEPRTGPPVTEYVYSVQQLDGGPALGQYVDARPLSPPLQQPSLTP
jgi:chromosome segregation ATPase